MKILLRIDCYNQIEKIILLQIKVQYPYNVINHAISRQNRQISITADESFVMVVT